MPGTAHEYTFALSPRPDQSMTVAVHRAGSRHLPACAVTLPADQVAAALQ